jgi:hypothetical protein
MDSEANLAVKLEGRREATVLHHHFRFRERKMKGKESRFFS